MEPDPHRKLHQGDVHELRLESRGLVHVPFDLPPTLTSLSLSDNRLRDLGGALVRLPMLRHLDLGKNLLRCLSSKSAGGSGSGAPASASSELPTGESSRLETLILDANEFGMGGAEGLGGGALADLPRLRTLSLCGCAYKNRLALPSELWRLHALEELNLNYCGLGSIVPTASLHVDQPEFGQLSGLRRLDLVGNRLSDLGEQLWACSVLEVLVLTDNDLKALHPGITRLTQLRRLFLRFNQLATLPNSMFAATILTGESISAGLPNLTELDVRDNRSGLAPPPPMIQRWAAASADRTLWSDATTENSCALHRVGPALPPPVPAPGAHPSLESQLAPHATTVLRARLADLFGVTLDPLVNARPEVMQHLVKCVQYTRTTGDDSITTPTPASNTTSSSSGRWLRRLCGTPVPQPLLTELKAALEATVFPAKRLRSGLHSNGYMVLSPPGEMEEQARALAAAAQTQQQGQQHDSRAESRGGKRTSKQKKLLKQQQTHGRLWRATAAILRAADPDYAAAPFHLAITKNFVGSPHIDRYDTSFQYALSLGDFRGGGELCVEESRAGAVAMIDTKARLACVDGRWCHWVRAYEGTRYSVIAYLTDKAYGTPKGTAVRSMPTFQQH